MTAPRRIPAYVTDKGGARGSATVGQGEETASREPRERHPLDYPPGTRVVARRRARRRYDHAQAPGESGGSQPPGPAGGESDHGREQCIGEPEQQELAPQRGRRRVRRPRFEDDKGDHDGTPGAEQGARPVPGRAKGSSSMRGNIEASWLGFREGLPPQLLEALGFL